MTKAITLTEDQRIFMSLIDTSESGNFGEVARRLGVKSSDLKKSIEMGRKAGLVSVRNNYLNLTLKGIAALDACEAAEGRA